MDTNLDRKQRDLDLNVQLGNQLANLRDNADLSQEQIAAQLGFARSTISKIEHGQRVLNAVEIPDYAQALRLSPSVIFGEIDRIVTEYDSSKQDEPGAAS